MECFIELWSVRQAWKQLSREERKAYLEQIEPHLQSLLEKGVEIVGWGVNDEATTHRANFDFYAVWKFPTLDMKKEFEAVVMEANWYNYFHQENVSGELTIPDEIIGKLIAL
ncbi:DUF6616 family protein [uncultured Draconibacterium sp.]|uniref:DUF6616 family protein n=1 Tax=uncultured Draconibacterium sp. TaxID=1573823 RepID=UPI002AA78B70|nr:DUF6616 family protein [uncultured Draconibacterium sp.]